ncbi:MAG: type VII secretion integral membrane protein EccD [Propionibacteriaceae bacterium]
MSTSTGEDLARVTVISPTRRIDLALPGAATLGEILPNIIRFSGYEGGAPNEAVHQWVLQRFGEDPLDVTKQVSQLDIRDGETLHLRQLEATMPDAAFDDVVDAVATSTSTRPSWTAGHSRRMALGVATAIILVIPATLLVSHQQTATAAITIGLAVIAAIGAFLCSRAFGRASVAATLGWQSTVLAGLGGYFLLTGADRPIRVLIGAALVLLLAGVMGLGAQVHPYAFLAVALSALVAVIGSMVAVLMPTHVDDIAAITMAVMLATMPAMPSMCYRLARVAMPNLPTSADELAQDNTPVQSDIVSRAIIADKLLGSMITAAVIVATLAALIVLSGSTWRGSCLCLAVSLALLLRARAFVGVSQRLVLLVGGSLILVGAAARMLLKIDMDALRIAVGVAGAVVVTLILAQFAARAAKTRISPFWGRMADVLEWLSLMAIVPLVLWVLDLYAMALGLTG